MLFSRARCPVTQQREVSAEALEQMIVNVAQLADVVEADAAAVAEVGAAESDLPLDVGQRRPLVIKPGVGRFGAQTVGDGPGTAGGGDRDRLVARHAGPGRR